MLAQLGIPDMKLPIQYALSYPQRYDCSFGRLDLLQCHSLTFETPDKEAFPSLQTAIDCGRAGGRLDIPEIVRCVVDSHSMIPCPSLEEIEETDYRVRIKTKELIAHR